MNPRVTQVVPLENYQLKVTFTNGEVRLFDTSPYLNGTVFQPLRNPGYFKTVRVAHGTITWPNKADFCPDTVYELSTPLTEQEAT